MFAATFSSASAPKAAATAPDEKDDRQKPASAKGKANRRIQKTRTRPGFGTALERWSSSIPLTGKALALADDVLFVAGTPVAFPEDDLAQAYEGRMGGVLWAASAATGQKVAEVKLDAPPVWDSLAVAGGRLYIATTDGMILCYGTDQ